MHIGLTYDLQTDASDERQAEFDPPATIQALHQALESLGHHVTRIGGAEALLRLGPKRCCDLDLVFNIAEGMHGRCREAVVPRLLELWGIPFVGSGAVTQALALDKALSKQLAQASGVRTPAWCVIDTEEQLACADELGFPLIVKPRYVGSGMGIDRGAVVHDLESLRRRVAWALERFHQSCVVEQFIPFGELTVLVIGNTPPQPLPVIQRPLDPTSRLSCHVDRSGSSTWLSPVELTPTLEAQATTMAITMFHALSCHDMARIDLRVDEQGLLYLYVA